MTSDALTTVPAEAIHVVLTKTLRREPAQLIEQDNRLDRADDEFDARIERLDRQARTVKCRARGHDYSEVEPKVRAARRGRGDRRRGRGHRRGNSCGREWSGYHRRSRAETKMHCVKLPGQRRVARDVHRQSAEPQARAAVLNGYTAPGILATEPVG